MGWFMQGDVIHDPVQHTDPAARYAASHLFDCLSHLSVSYVLLICRFHLSVSSLGLIFPSHLSLLSVYFTVSVCFLCLSHFTVPRLSISSFCHICLSHLPVSCSILSIWCYLSDSSVCFTVSLFCLFYLSISSVWFTCCLSQLSVSPFIICLSFFLFVYLSYSYAFPSCSLYSACVHSVCISASAQVFWEYCLSVVEYFSNIYLNVQAASTSNCEDSGPAASGRRFGYGWAY